jgi:hypothetical protein
MMVWLCTGNRGAADQVFGVESLGHSAALRSGAAGKSQPVVGRGSGAYGAMDRIEWATECQLDVSNSSTQIADLASSYLMKAAPMFLYMSMISKPPA